MVVVDMWYGDLASDAEKINIIFYPNECIYRGNIWVNGRIVGDYWATSSTALEKRFPQLVFKW